MIKRTIAVLMAVATAGLLGLLSPGAAVAAAVDAPAKSITQVLPLEAEPPVGSKCSGTASWGKIRYQVCIRWNCDSTACWVRGYFGLINTADGTRNVDWWLYKGFDNAPDGNGEVSLGAGQQRTTLAPTSRRLPCPIKVREGLQIQYDSAGRSPIIYVEADLPCA